MKKENIIAFKIGRGGRFNNSGHLTFLSRGISILSFPEVINNTFDTKKGNLTDQSGNEVMDAKDFKKAKQTGIGRVDFDGDYNTIYTTLLNDLTEEEILAIQKDNSYDADTLNEELKNIYPELY